MNARLLLVAVVTLLAPLGACAASPDPTSSAALIVAPPFQWGTKCTQFQTSSVDGAMSSTEAQVCEDGLQCDTQEAAGTNAAVGDAGSSVTAYNADPVFFEGTCADPQHETPVSCSQRQPQDDCDVCQYASCCPYVALCEDDPNCTAVNDCVNTCATDDICAEACLTNGDPTAVADWQAALSCIDASCAASCD